MGGQSRLARRGPGRTGQGQQGGSWPSAPIGGSPLAMRANSGPVPALRWPGLGPESWPGPPGSSGLSRTSEKPSTQQGNL